MSIFKTQKNHEKIPIIRRVLLTSLPSFLVAETFFAILYLVIINFFTGIFWAFAMLEPQNLETNMQIFSFANIAIFIGAIASMSIVMCLEISTIITITTYDYYRNDHIPFKKLLGFSYEKLQTFLKLRSLPFFLFIFFFPKAQIAPQTIFALNIPDFITAELVKFPLYSAIIFGFLALGIWFIYRSIFVLHYLFLERATILRAFKSSFRLTAKIGPKSMMIILFKNIFWIFLFIIPIIAIGVAFARILPLAEPLFGNSIWWISDILNNLIEFIFIGLIGAIFLAGITVAYIRHSGYQKKHFESRFHFLKDYPHFEPRWKNVKFFLQKKRLFATACILGLLFPLFLMVIIRTDNSTTISDPMIISHRGVSENNFIENTIAGILEAKNQGADMVEIDVYENADGTLILSHDPTPKRVAGVNIHISELRDQELENIILPNGEKIPTLTEALQVANMHNISLLIEPKIHGKEKNLIQTLTSEIDRNNMIWKTYIHSFDANLLKQIKKTQPHLKVGLIIFGGFGRFGATEVDFFSLQERLISRSIINNIKQYEKKIFVWTVNNKLPVENYMRLGVDGIITDDIKLIRTRTEEISARYQKWPQMLFRFFRIEFSHEDIISWFKQVFSPSEKTS